MAAPTYSSWKNDISGLWTASADWTSGSPNAGSVGAILGTMTTAYTVTSTGNETVYSLEVDTGATLNITGGVFTNYSSLGYYSNTYLTGVIDIGAAAKMVFGKTGSPGNYSAEIYGTGKVNIQGGALEIAAPWFGNFGAHIVLSNNAEIIALSAGSSLNNRKDGLISGSGTIGGGIALQITNNLGATIDASGAAGSALTIDTGGFWFENAGLLESTGLGGLVINGNLGNDGTLLAAVGTITLNNCFDGNNGTTIVDAGAKIMLHDSIIGTTGPLDIGSATAIGGVVSTTTGDMTVTGTSNPPTGDALWIDAFNYGAINIVDDSVLNANAFIDDMISTASLNLMASGTGVAELVVFDGGTEVAGGEINLSNAAGNKILSNGTSDSFGNGAVLAGSGVIGDGFLRLINYTDGVVDANGSVGLTIVGVTEGTEQSNYNLGLVEATGSGKLTIGGAFNNAGVLEAASAAGITLNGAQIASGGGKVIVAANGALILENGAQISHQFKISIAKGGVLSTLSGAASDLIGSDIFDSGTINVGAGSSLNIQNHFVSTATAVVNVGGSAGAATIDVAAGAFWDLLGAGAINLANAGDKIVGAGAGAQLWDNGVTIKGAGQIGDGVMAIYVSDSGVIDATGALAFDNNAGMSGNAGLLEATKGGKLTIMNSLYNAGEVAANGGKVILDGALNGPGDSVVEGGGTLELASADNTYLSFGAGGGVLQIDTIGSMNNNVYGFTKGDTIDLRGLSFVSGHMALGADTIINPLVSLISFTNGAATSQDFIFEGNYTAANLLKQNLHWTFAADGNKGTYVTLA